MKIFSFDSRPRCAVLCAALSWFGVLSVAPALLISQTPGKPSEAERKIIEKKLDLLPLRFEPNQGQSSSDAKFLAQGRKFSALFKENETDFLFAGHSATSAPLRISLLNASRNAAISGEKRLPGTVNYFIGKDREKWHTGLPTFEHLRYSNVYPGTDLIFYGNNGSLEFDFQLSPGSAPSQIQMRFECAQSLRIDSKGDLIVTANDGHISFQKPVIYQFAEGGRQEIIAGAYKILKKDTISFTVEKYDRTRPLIIDPILNYSTYIGGGAEAMSIAVDQNGEAYIAGLANLDFPTTPGSYQPGSIQCPADGSCLFVAKFNSTGTALLYSTILAGDGVNTIGGIVLDANGDAFVAGSTTSTDFPITTGAFQTTNNASGTIGFVTELDNTGTSLIYSTFFGGSTMTYITQVAIDASGSAYLTGFTFDTDFPTTPGAFRTVLPTKDFSIYKTGFITKLNSTGTALVYSTYLGGSRIDWPLAIAVDNTGEAYVGGNTSSSNFPVTTGAIQSTREASNYQAGFITKMNASGSALVYSTYLDGNSVDSVNSIALDSNGNAYATGSTNSPDFPITAGAFQSKIGIAQTNAFVTELNGSGTSLVYSTFLGGGISLGGYYDMGDQANGIAVDGQGMVYLTGMACTGDYPVTAGAFETQNLDGEIDGECTAFLTKMNPAPNAPLLYSTYLGGTGNGGGGFTGEEANGLAIDPSGNAYLAGFTYSIDFPVTPGVFETAFDGPVVEAFVTEFNGSEMKPLPIPTVTLTSNTSSVLFSQPVTFTATVQPASGSSTPTGYIGFNFLQWEASDEGGTGLGFGPWITVALNGAGTASFTTSSLDRPQTQVNAFYLGDANNASATGTMTQSMTDLATTMTVTSSANNFPYDAPVVFTAFVQDSTGKPAQGGVTFMAGGFPYAISGLDSAGQAAWTNGIGGPPLPLGTDTLDVYFTGALHSGWDESSGSINVTVTPLGMTPAPSFAPPPGTYIGGQLVTLSDSNTSATIFYTTDGSTPVLGASLQFVGGGEIGVYANETIKAVAVVSGDSPSSVISAAYTITSPPPPPGFTTGPGATTSMTVTTGSTSGNTGTVSVVGTNGFSGTVNLTCSVNTAMPGTSDMPTCSLNPVSVTLSGTTSKTSILTVATTAASSAENRTRILFWMSPGGTALALALFFGGFRRRRARWAILGLFVLAGMSACGGGSGGGGGSGISDPGTTLGNYTITVTGASGGISAIVGTVTLTVQ